MIYDVIIIGKGPAGISTALYTKRAGLNTLVIGISIGALEKTEQIENYYGFKEPITGQELFENGIEQAERIGVEIVADEVISINFDRNFKILTKNSKVEGKTLVLATGTNRKTPKIKGIKEFEGKGISYCAICDAFFYKNRNVAILGSGEYALNEAKELEKVVNSITILTNGQNKKEELEAKIEKEFTKEQQVKIKINTNKIRKFTGNSIIENIEFEDNSNIKTDGVFIAEGIASSVDLARKIGITINNNYIIVDENQMTNIKGVYAVGDCTGGILQISKAVYEGTKAGLNIIKYLRKN